MCSTVRNPRAAIIPRRIPPSSGGRRRLELRLNKIKLGFFSFTEITDPGEHHSYNEWHQLDHMPEQFPIPGIAFGERWVSTPDCTRARLIDDGLVSPIHYVTCYYMTEPVDRTLVDFVDWGGQLRALGRFHLHRKAHIGGPFLFLKGYVAPRVLVSPEAIAYRPKRGVIVSVTDLVDATAEPEVNAWLDRVHHPDLLTVPGIAGLWSFISRGEAGGAFEGRNPPGRRITLMYLDEDPVEVTAQLAEKLKEWRKEGRIPDLEKKVKTVFTGPLETITPWRWDWFDGETS